MNSFFHAVGFLSRLPVPTLSSSPKDWERSVVFYPLVGAIMGLILWGAALLFNTLFPPLLSSVLILAFWIYLTGGLHLDGWMDLADGLGSNRAREQMLEIMKDSRVGAMGVIAAVVLMMMKGAAIYHILEFGFLFWLVLPMLGARFFLVIAIWMWPYITEKGMGFGLQKELTAGRICLGTLFTVLVLFAAFGFSGLFVFAASLLSGWMFARYMMKRLGGLTGDCYGALVEWLEVSALLFILLVERWLG